MKRTGVILSSDCILIPDRTCTTLSTDDASRSFTAFLAFNLILSFLQKRGNFRDKNGIDGHGNVAGEVYFKFTINAY